MTAIASKGGDMVLSDEQELELKCLISDKRPCEWRQAMHLFKWVVDMKCPIRKIVREEVEKYFREKEHEKYFAEYPDERG